MKKFYLLLSFALILHVSLNAQSLLTSKIDYGIRGSVAFSNLYGSKNYQSYPSGNYYSLDKKDFLTSYSVGFWAQYPLSKQLSLTAELNLTEKGQQYPIKGVLDGQSYEITIKPKLTYIGLPVTVQYNFKKLSRLGIYGGLEPAFLVRARQIVTGNMDAGKNVITSNFNRFDLGIIAGANFRIIKDIKLDVRLVNGLRDISPSREHTYTSNKSVQVGIIVPINN